MDALRHDWLTQGLIDYEYKKYILLAYLKSIRGKFDAAELYPFLSDLVFHYRNLEKIKKSKDLIFENFPKSISRADFQRLEITYRKVVEDDAVMEELENIIAFALPQITDAIARGQELHSFVEEHLELQPVGLAPIYNKEGYLFINQDRSKMVTVYRYNITLFESSHETYRGIATHFIYQVVKSLVMTYENLKIELSRRFTDLPNPATFLLVSKMRFPENETLLPIAKRLLVKNISVV